MHVEYRCAVPKLSTVDIGAQRKSSACKLSATEKKCTVDLGARKSILPCDISMHDKYKCTGRSLVHAKSLGRR
jgi:hypothetical protein